MSPKYIKKPKLSSESHTNYYFERQLFQYIIGYMFNVFGWKK